MVIIPGLGALGYLLPMVRACSAWTRVHLLDVPGFGHRRTARCPAGVVDVAQAVAAWLDAVPSDPVVLLGHSTGAQAALQTVVAVPGRVRAVVLAGPTFPPEARRWRPLIARVAQTLPHESPGEILATFPNYLRGGRGVLTLLQTSMADVPELLVPRVHCPVVVLRGEHDAVSPAAWATRLAAAAQCGRVATVAGAHNFCYTEAEAASTAVHNAVADLLGTS